MLAPARLCARGTFHPLARPPRRHGALFDAHPRAFRAFGGIARRGMVDTRLAATAAHELVAPEVCSGVSGLENGGRARMGRSGRTQS